MRHAAGGPARQRARVQARALAAGVLLLLPRQLRARRGDVRHARQAVPGERAVRGPSRPEPLQGFDVPRSLTRVQGHGQQGPGDPPDGLPAAGAHRVRGGRPRRVQGAAGGVPERRPGRRRQPRVLHAQGGALRGGQDPVPRRAAGAGVPGGHRVQHRAVLLPHQAVRPGAEAPGRDHRAGRCGSIQS